MARETTECGARCWGCAIDSLAATGLLAGDPLDRTEGGEMRGTFDRMEMRDGQEYRVYRLAASRATTAAAARERCEAEGGRMRAAVTGFAERFGAVSATEAASMEELAWAA